MFWGINLKQGESYDFKGLTGKTLIVRSVCLGKNSDSDKYFLTLTHKNNTFNLTSVQKDKSDFVSLDNTILIEPGMKLQLTGTGKAEVSVTGHFEDEINEAFEHIQANNESFKNKQVEKPKVEGGKKEVQVKQQEKKLPLKQTERNLFNKQLLLLIPIKKMQLN
jgi:hypothetical protein